MSNNLIENRRCRISTVANDLFIRCIGSAAKTSVRSVYNNGKIVMKIYPLQL